MKEQTFFGFSSWLIVAVAPCLFFIPDFAEAQGMAGETSSAIHGAPGTPGTNAETGVVQPSEIGRTINRPEDNAPRALDEITPAGSDEGRLGTGEYQDKVEQHQSDSQKNDKR